MPFSLTLPSPTEILTRRVRAIELARPVRGQSQILEIDTVTRGGVRYTRSALVVTGTYNKVRGRDPEATITIKFVDPQIAERTYLPDDEVVVHTVTYMEPDLISDGGAGMLGTV